MNERNCLHDLQKGLKLGNNIGKVSVGDGIVTEEDRIEVNHTLDVLDCERFDVIIDKNLNDLKTMFRKDRFLSSINLYREKNVPSEKRNGVS